MTGLSGSVATTIDFVRTDGGLPLNFGAFQRGVLLIWIPISTDLNQYRLAVTGLPAGKYAVEVETQRYGEFTPAQLGAGVDLGIDPFNPWWPIMPWGGKSLVLSGVTDARLNLQFNHGFSQTMLGTDPGLAALDTQFGAIDNKAIKIQRLTAAPYGMHFTIRKTQ